MDQRARTTVLQSGPHRGRVHSTAADRSFPKAWVRPVPRQVPKSSSLPRESNGRLLRGLNDVVQPRLLLLPGPVPAFTSRPSVGCTATGALIFLGFLASLLPCFWLLAIAVSSAPMCSYWCDD